MPASVHLRGCFVRTTHTPIAMKSPLLHLCPRFRVFFVGHLANPGKIELRKVGSDGAVEVSFDSENASKNFVELALVRVSLVDNVEQGAGRIWRQARGGVPACPAGINDVQSVHLQAASPENAVLQEDESEGNFTLECQCTRA